MIVYTAYFTRASRPRAVKLGTALYGALTRPLGDRLAFGAGVPIRPGVNGQAIDTDASEDAVIVCPIDARTTTSPKARQRAIELINSWNKALGPGRVIPVILDRAARALEPKLQAPVLSGLFAPENPEEAIVDAVIAAIARVLSKASANPRIFISHAKIDLPFIDELINGVRSYIHNTTLSSFWDVSELYPGHPLKEQLWSALDQDSLFLSVRSDNYSDRGWCLEELRRAKSERIACLTVLALEDGECRSSSYGGNTPTMVWRAGRARDVVARGLSEWIKARMFEREAERIGKLADLPQLVSIPRTPELLDLASDRVRSASTRLILHPDPELPRPERSVLSAADRRLALLTPTTAYRRLDFASGKRTEDEQLVESLANLNVGMSLSDNPDTDNRDGVIQEHMHDAITYTARCLLSAGASIGYGGDFRRLGFTEQLVQLTHAYAQNAPTPVKWLNSYLASNTSIEEADPDWAFDAHSVADDDKRSNPLPWPQATGDEQVPPALYYSEMRAFMARQLDAAVMIGGAPAPRLSNREAGYGGLYPGIVEEAWQMLLLKKPVYAVGGFGGAASMLAQVMAGENCPKELQAAFWTDRSQYFAKRSRAISCSPYLRSLGLPASMEELAERIRELTKRYRKPEVGVYAPNGLSPSENNRLRYSTDPAEIASLIMRGLLRVETKETRGKLKVELVRGDVLRADDVDAISVPIAEGVPTRGVAGRIDEALDYRISTWADPYQTVIGAANANIAAEWVHIARLVPKAQPRDGALVFDVGAAARDAVQRAKRFKFRRMATVAYGGTLESHSVQVIDEMLRAFVRLRDTTTVVWYEADAIRYKQIHAHLEAKWAGDVHLTSREGEALDDRGGESSRSRATYLIANLSEDNRELSTVLVPPAGTSACRGHQRAVTPEEIARLIVGGGKVGRSVPSVEAVGEYGDRVADLLLGTSRSELAAILEGQPLHVVHNPEASKIPFETLRFNDGAGVATEVGLTRRLVIEGARGRQIIATPPMPGVTEVLVIVDPTEDLPGAEQEGLTVKEALEERVGIEVVTLKGAQATRDAVLQELGSAQILHYCGHAYFDGEGAGNSGLRLAGGTTLQVADLLRLTHLPRLAVINGCESARVRGGDGTEGNGSAEEEEDLAKRAEAFAEFFMRSGIEAYLGTYWFVSDLAARTFAEKFYERLLEGESVAEAVRVGRGAMPKERAAHWANYLLYGEGNFALFPRGLALRRSTE
ncbi:MAG: CHAT domain-containing protein [Pseudomonadota bacterium]